MAKNEIALTPKQVELLSASQKYPVVFFGGARGGGKSHGLRAVCLIRASEIPALKVALFRRSYPELVANHVRPLLSAYPWLTKYYNKSEHVIAIPNKSTIEFCYCDSYDDVLRYQGREWDILAIDEAGQWDEASFWSLRASNRSSRRHARPVTLLTGNPGGIGHRWLKRLFVDRQFNGRERGEDFHFIKSKVYDCPPLIENDPDYISRLEAEPNEVLRRAYLDGDWDVFAGQFYGE
jgi:phage terminase large subunit